MKTHIFKYKNWKKIYENTSNNSIYSHLNSIRKGDEYEYTDEYHESITIEIISMNDYVFKESVDSSIYDEIYRLELDDILLDDNSSYEFDNNYKEFHVRNNTIEGKFDAVISVVINDHLKWQIRDADYGTEIDVSSGNDDFQDDYNGTMMVSAIEEYLKLDWTNDYIYSIE